MAVHLNFLVFELNWIESTHMHSPWCMRPNKYWPFTRARAHTHTHTHTHTQTLSLSHTHTYARTHARTHTHTYTNETQIEAKLYCRPLQTLGNLSRITFPSPTTKRRPLRPVCRLRWSKFSTLMHCALSPGGSVIDQDGVRGHPIRPKRSFVPWAGRRIILGWLSEMISTPQRICICIWWLGSFCMAFCCSRVPLYLYYWNQIKPGKQPKQYETYLQGWKQLCCQAPTVSNNVLLKKSACGWWRGCL
jgi:hypothetical protein